MAACDARLAWDVPGVPTGGTVDCRRAPGLFGEVSCLGPEGALRPVGGCGSGRTAPEFVTEFVLFMGELTTPMRFLRVAAEFIFTPVMNSCLLAS